MYQYLALTSLRDSHPLPTRHIHQPGHRQAAFLLTSVFPFPYFRFRTSVSALQCFPLAHSGFCFDRWLSLNEGMVYLYQYTYDISILQVWRKTTHRSWQTYLAQNHQLEQEACLRGKNDILVTHDCLTAAQLFPHHLLVPGWSPHHLLQPATRTVPERETEGAWYTPFYADHSLLASPERRAHHFLPRTR